MKCNLEIDASIKLQKEDGTYEYFVVGDEIVCCAGESRKYIGKIDNIGSYQEDTDSEGGELAIYLNTSKSKMSYSGEIIKIDDITYIGNIKK